MTIMKPIPIVIYTYTSKSTLNLKPTVDLYLEWLIDSGYEPVIIKGIDVRPGYLNRVMNYLDESYDRPYFINYFGHGLPDRLLGLAEHKLLKNFDPLILMRAFRDKDKYVLYNNVIYTWACSSMQVLGKWAVNDAGAIAYFGNNEPIRFTRFDIDRDYIEDYTDISLTIPMAMLKGASVSEAYEKFQKKVDEFIVKYTLINNAIGTHIAQSLRNLRENYIYFGDGSFRFKIGNKEE